MIDHKKRIHFQASLITAWNKKSETFLVAQYPSPLNFQGSIVWFLLWEMIFKIAVACLGSLCIWSALTTTKGKQHWLSYHIVILLLPYTCGLTLSCILVNSEMIFILSLQMNLFGKSQAYVFVNKWNNQ